MTVANDTFARPARRHRRGWGVAVVCGAGHQLRRRRPGRPPRRFPALGAITGDWGGGYDVGLAALAAAARSADGRGPRTLLERAVPGALRRSRRRRSWPRRSTSAGSPTARLIELAPVVLAEARADPVAPGSSTAWRAEIVALARVALRRASSCSSARSRCCSAAACSSSRTRRPGGARSGRSSRRGRPAGRAAPGGRRRRSSAPALLALDELGSRRRGAGARCARELARSDGSDARGRLMAEVRFERATAHLPGRRRARARRARPGDRRRRADGARRPVGLRQDDGAADARRARGGRRRARSTSTAATSPTTRRRTATWRWCSRTTRSTRT